MTRLRPRFFRFAQLCLSLSCSIIKDKFSLELHISQLLRRRSSTHCTGVGKCAREHPKIVKFSFFAVCECLRREKYDRHLRTDDWNDFARGPLSKTIQQIRVEINCSYWIVIFVHRFPEMHTRRALRRAAAHRKWLKKWMNRRGCWTSAVLKMAILQRRNRF